MVAVHSELAFGEEGRGGPPMDPKNDKAKAEAVMRYVRRLKLVPFAFGCATAIRCGHVGSTGMQSAQSSAP